jgi:hypothetical protein
MRCTVSLLFTIEGFLRPRFSLEICEMRSRSVRTGYMTTGKGEESPNSMGTYLYLPVPGKAGSGHSGKRTSIPTCTPEQRKQPMASTGNRMGVVVGRGSAVGCLGNEHRCWRGDAGIGLLTVPVVDRRQLYGSRDTGPYTVACSDFFRALTVRVWYGTTCHNPLVDSRLRASYG